MGQPQSAVHFESGLRAERSRLLYEGIPTALATNTLLALILVSVLWPLIATDNIALGKLFAWIVMLAAILLSKAFLAMVWRHEEKRAANLAAHWLYSFRAITVAAGVAWGAAGVLLFPQGYVLQQVPLAFVMASVSVDAITLLAADQVSVFGFLAAMLVPLALRFGMEANPVSLSIDVMIALYLIFVAANVNRAGRCFRENVRLRTQAREHDQVLRIRNQDLNLVAKCSPDNIIRYDLECRAVYVNHMMERTVNVTTASLIGEIPVESRFDGFAGVEAYQAALQRVIGTGAEENVEITLLDRGGNERTHQFCIVAERDGDGRITGAVAFGRDITEHKMAEAELRIAATAFDADGAMVITDANAVILRINRGFTDITGYASEEALGRKMNLLNSGRHDASFYAAMWENIDRTGTWRGEIWNRRKCGEIYPQNLSIAAVRRNDGIATHYVATLRDLTKRKAADEKIRHLAFYDSLTQLPNRRLLLDRLQHTLASSVRNKKRGALMLIDLDNFKTLNDTLGHDKGDLLLQQVAQRLTACVREGDTVARLGDDEFVVILEKHERTRERRRSRG